MNGEIARDSMVATPPRIVKRTRVRISKSGQITLPAAMRRSLNVDVGDYVTLQETDDHSITLQPDHVYNIDDLIGILGTRPGNLDDVLKDARQFGSVRQSYGDGSGRDDTR